MKTLKLLAIVLAAVMLLSSVSVGVSAAQTEGSEEAALPNDIAEQEDYLTETGANASTVKITGAVNVSDGAKISWKAFTGAASYAVFLNNGEGYEELGTVSELSFTHAPLENGADCFYNVRALDAQGGFISDFAANDFENVFYLPPVISSVSSTDNGVKVKWNEAEGVSRFAVYRAQGTGNLSKLAEAEGLEYLDTTAVSGKSYTYAVRSLAEDGSVLSYYSANASVNYVQLPGITSIENTSTGAKISWKKPAGVDRIRLYYKNGSGWTRITETTDSSYTHDKLTGGKSFIYTVRGVDSKGNFTTDFSREGWENTFIEPPVISSMENKASGTLLKWKAPAGSSRFRVFYKTEGKSWQRMFDTDETSYLAENTSSGTKYTYTVRCINEDGSRYTSYYTSGKSVTYIAVPEITSLSATATGTEIKWTMPKGAERIRVYYRGEKDWVKLTETTGTSYTHDKLTSGKSYKYTLRCVDEDGDFISDFNREGWIDTFYAPPVIKSIEATDKGIEIKWDRANGAEDYRLFRKTSGKSWERVIATEESSYVDTKVNTGTTYTYTLRIVKKDGETYMSYYNSGKSITYSLIPAIKKIENTASGAKITWDKVEGADYYRLYYKNSSGGWTRLASKYLLEYTDTSVKDGETRVYTIRCLNSNDDFVSGFSKTGWSNTFHAAPAITSVSYKDGAYTLKWEAKEGVAGYRVYRKPLNGSFARVNESTAETTYTDNTVSKDKLYCYTVRCLDEEGNVISGFISKVKFYKNGKVASGNIYQDGTYGFKDGYLMTGLNRVNGLLRYYNSEGRMYRDTLIGNSSMGYYYVDPDGVCIESSEMRLAAEFMKRYCKGDTLYQKFKYGYLYIAHNFDYERRYTYPSSPSDLAEYATDMFTNHSGDCYRYAVCVAYMAKIAGFRTLVGVGEENASGGDHGWTEVLVDGYWYICDAESEIPNFGRDDYDEYMVTNSGHCWGVSADWYAELVIKDGKAYFELY